MACEPMPEVRSEPATLRQTSRILIGRGDGRGSGRLAGLGAQGEELPLLQHTEELCLEV